MKLYHVSEDPGIEIFHPRISPSEFEGLKEPVVFAISDKLLHNYLLPRNCPRVCLYVSDHTSQEDKSKFFRNTDAEFIMVLESKWMDVILHTKIYCYEFDPAGFVLLDTNAGYFVSRQATRPTSVRPIENPLLEIGSRNVETRFTPSLERIAEEVKRSSLGFSLIRMNYASLNKTLG